ncbi:MAG: hypothetical protein N2167_03070 [Flavobacteriales bacterium]|nr:hypothetical protein [Flavobacteriales bacterium]
MKIFLFIFNFLVLTQLFVIAQSQSALLKDLNATDIYVLKIEYNSSSYGNRYFTSLLEKKWPFSIQRDEKGWIEKIILVRSGVLEEVFLPDIKAHPIYFTDNKNRLGYIQGIFIYYTSSDDVSNIKYFFSTDKDKLTKLTDDGITKLKEDFIYYLLKEREVQANAKTELIANKEKELEAEKAKNSIKGKNITKLEVVWETKESETGLDSKIFYGIKAYDANGSVYSTSNLGGKLPWDDFEITCKGAGPGHEFLMVPANCENLSNDYVTLTVKSKHHTNLITSSKIKLSYVTPVNIVYSGNGSIPGNSDRACSGKSGMDLFLWTTVSADGSLNLVQVKDAAGNVLHKIKVKPGVPVNVFTRGAGGCSGANKVPGHGGDGGDVTIYKSPGMDISFIQIFNNGGKAGKGSGYAKDGEDGNIIEKVQQVSLNF